MLGVSSKFRWKASDAMLKQTVKSLLKTLGSDARADASTPGRGFL
mgnify:CR=1 FL=1|jgi:hypothetical protein